MHKSNFFLKKLVVTWSRQVRLTMPTIFENLPTEVPLNMHLGPEIFNFEIM